MLNTITCIAVGCAAAIALNTTISFAAPSTPENVVVDLSDRTLYFRGQAYPISHGGPGTPTPIGTFDIDLIGWFNWLNLNPIYGASFEEGTVNGKKGFYAIHGGGAHLPTWGCVQLNDEDVAAVVGQLKKGDRITIQN